MISRGYMKIAKKRKLRKCIDLIGWKVIFEPLKAQHAIDLESDLVSILVEQIIGTKNE